jgi:acetyl esterase/lipase
MKNLTSKSMSKPVCHTLALTAFATFGLINAVQAQVPADLVPRIAAMGRVNDPAKTQPLYIPLHGKEPYTGVKVTRDVKYGPHERNTLDLFVPEGGASGRPVFMFVHGGGFIRGSKRQDNSPFYDNVMLWAVRNGMIGVNVEYRLAPQATWPSGNEDLSMAVRWAGDNAAANGGDANKVYLMGHSAGASHVGLYVAHTQFHGPKGVGIAGAILSSGTYDFTASGESEGRVAYFGNDRSVDAARSSLPGLVKSSVPIMANAAELDPPAIYEQLGIIKKAMCNSPRGCIRTLEQPKHNHMSQSYSIGTSDTMLTTQILDFIKTGK